MVWQRENYFPNVISKLCTQNRDILQVLLKAVYRLRIVSAQDVKMHFGWMNSKTIQSAENLGIEKWKRRSESFYGDVNKKTVFPLQFNCNHENGMKSDRYIYKDIYRIETLDEDNLQQTMFIQEKNEEKEIRGINDSLSDGLIESRILTPTQQHKMPLIQFPVLIWALSMWLCCLHRAITFPQTFDIQNINRNRMTVSLQVTWCSAYCQ